MKVFIKIGYESIVMALRELRVNKMRTILSLLGITIGILCVISIFTVVDSLELNLRSSINKLGSNVIYIQKMPWAPEPGETEYPWWKYINRPVAKYDEMKSIQDNVAGAKSAAIAIWAGGFTVKHGSKSVSNITLSGVSHDYNSIMDLEFKNGRYFTDMESAGGQKKVVLGFNIAENLFGSDVDPTGATIELFGEKLIVIGELIKDGESILDNSNDNQILMPYFFLSTKIDVEHGDSEPTILVQAKDGISNDEVKDEIKGVLRASRRIPPNKENNFALNQLSIISEQLNTMFGVIGFAGLIIGGFSILVGGFGIANIMFVSVRERTNLIGIKKALGAKRQFILLEFLIEAIILCLIGGLSGLLLVFLLVQVANASVDFKFALNSSNVILGLGISVGIGIISGFFPAWSAGRLDPVVAIRFK